MTIDCHIDVRNVRHSKKDKWTYNVNQLCLDVEYDRELLIWNTCVNMEKAMDYNRKEFTLCDEAV